MSNLKQNTLKFLLGALSYRGASFLLIPILTQNLTPADFGLADYYMTQVTFLTVLLGFGAADGLVRFVNSSQESNSFAHFGFKLSCLGCAIGAIVIFLRAPTWLSLNIAIILALSIQSSLLKALLRAKGKITLHTQIEIIGATILYSATVFFVGIHDFGVMGFLYATELSYSLTLAIGTLRISNDLASPKINTTVNIANFLKFSLPMALNQLSWWYSMWIARFQVASKCSSQDLADYALASKVGSLIAFVVLSGSQGWLLAVYSDERNQNHAYFTRILNHITSIGVVGICASMTFCAPLIALLSNQSYQNAYAILPLVVIASSLNSLLGLLGAFYLRAHATKRLTTESVFILIFTAAGTTTLVKYYSLIGVVSTIMVAQVILTAMRIQFCKKLIGHGLFSKLHLFYCFGVILCALLFHFSKFAPGGYLCLIVSCSYAIFTLYKSRRKTSICNNMK